MTTHINQLMDNRRYEPQSTLYFDYQRGLAIIDGEHRTIYRASIIERSRPSSDDMGKQRMPTTIIASFWAFKGFLALQASLPTNCILWVLSGRSSVKHTTPSQASRGRSRRIKSKDSRSGYFLLRIVQAYSLLLEEMGLRVRYHVQNAMCPTITYPCF